MLKCIICKNEQEAREVAKKVCVYGLSAAVCLVLGFLESLIPPVISVPGIKLGLANSASLILIASGDVKGALAVIFTRILLSALIFTAPFSLVFSLSGAAGSFVVMLLLSKTHKFGITGLSIAGGTAHNICQTAAAAAVLGKSVWYQLPVLLAGGAVSGAAVGLLTAFIFKRFYKKQ